MAARKQESRKKNPTRACSVRLFEADVKTLHNVAEKRGTSWQIELRLLVRRALRVMVIED